MKPLDISEEDKKRLEEAARRFVKEYGKTLIALADDCWHDNASQAIDGYRGEEPRCRKCGKELTLWNTL